MKIALFDVDGHKFPNLALMKLASYHRQQGDSVEFLNHLQNYDIAYKSKVFTFTKEDTTIIRADRIIKGGTGYNDFSVLPDAIEHTCPDYTLYPVTRWYDGKTAYGFSTRGCSNHCPWCIVPYKEGYIRQHADIHEFLSDKKKLILMDNNILASTHGLSQIQTLIREKIAVDFNQGLDARRIAGLPDIADLLSRVKYINTLRLACDTIQQLEPIQKTFELLKAKGFHPRNITVYCLIRDNLADAEKRVMKIRTLGGKPFVMPFRDYKLDTFVPRLHQDFARWVNHKATFYTCTWQEYQQKINKN